MVLLRVGKSCSRNMNNFSGGSMTGLVLLYMGAVLPAFWGFAHLFPTKSVVKGFGEISTDNKRIIAMEWIVEGVSLIYIGLVIAAATFTDPANEVSQAVYGLSIISLLVLAAVSLFTGFRIDFLPFKLCPVVFSVSAVLIFIGGFL